MILEHPKHKISCKILDILHFKPLPDMPVSGSFNSVANKCMISKYGQMGIQLSDRAENIVEKGEIACNEQFLIFPQCF